VRETKCLSLNGERNTKTTVYNQTGFFNYLIKDPETCKKNRAFVSCGINYGKGYIKMFPVVQRMEGRNLPLKKYLKSKAF
jgi:hypothetical protein